MSDRDDSEEYRTFDGEIEFHEQLTSIDGASAAPPDIANYRVLQRVGQGGMGDVYEAEQREPVRRRVALKVIKAGMDTEQVVARFESERQALALMNHPNVARVLDAGMTDKDRPYFAMEYVSGIPITDYCAKNRLSTDERLRLFMQVCDGVQHAHQKGVIHRDIKPSNVLVRIEGDEPVPVIIDFGLAKAISQPLNDRSLQTQLGQVIGTPEYMSPEQAEMSGLDVDTRTDVYSLGALLYEILVGELLFEPDTLRGGFEEIRRSIREQTPTLPSSRLSRVTSSESAAEGKRIPPQILSRELVGDLDWITMKALEKDRTRRYGSPGELAQDIARHLDNHPVMAGPPSRIYRLGKFLRRHKLGVAAGSLVLVALIVGLAGTAFGLVRARQAEARERQKAATAERVTELLVGLFEVSDPDEARGNTITAREILDRAAGRLSGELKEEPVVRAALMASVGEVYRSIGLQSKAKPLLDESLAIRRAQLGNDHPDTIAAITAMAHHHLDVGELDQAEGFYREALDASSRVLGEDDARTLLAVNNMGTILQEQGRLEEAERYTRQALEGRLEVLGRDHPDTLISLNDMGRVLEDQGKLEEAESFYLDALEGSQRLRGDDHTETLIALSNLGAFYRWLGELEQSEPYTRKALAGQRRVLGDDHLGTLKSVSNLGLLLQDQGRFDEAERYMREALEGTQRVLGDDHSSTLTAVNNLGFLLQDKKEFEEALPLFQKAYEGYRRTLSDEHRLTLNSMANLGDLYTSLGRPTEGEELLARAAEIAPVSLTRSQATTGLVFRKYGRCLTALGRYPRAESALLDAHGTLEAIFGEDHMQTQRVVQNLVELYDAWGRPQPAADWRAKLP